MKFIIPANQLNLDLDWGPGVSPGELILQEHDQRVIKKQLKL